VKGIVWCVTQNYHTSQGRWYCNKAADHIQSHGKTQRQWKFNIDGVIFKVIGKLNDDGILTSMVQYSKSSQESAMVTLKKRVSNNRIFYILFLIFF
jgi:hypothetical protein